MKIESYKIYKVSIPTRRRHTWASSTADVGQGWVILEVKTDDGIVGYGEATTMPEWGGDFGRYYGESYETTEVVIRDNLFPAIMGMDPFDIDLIHHKMDKAIRGFVYAKAAIDIALYDIMGKALDKPVYKLLGGQHRKAIPIAHSLGVVLDIEAAVDEAVAACGEGIKTIKMKGGLDPVRDHGADGKAPQGRRAAHQHSCGRQPRLPHRQGRDQVGQAHGPLRSAVSGAAGRGL